MARAGSSASPSDRDLEQVIRTLPGYDPYAQAEGYVFVPRRARFALEFFTEVIRYPKGRGAGEPFVLAPWQMAMIGNLWGWVDSKGRRRYRESFVYVAKKNGKTALAAGIVLLVLGTDGEIGAECYSAAASRDQAALVFGYAANMVRLEPELKRRLRVYGDRGGSQTRSIVYAEQMSFYRALAADAHTADGVNPHLVIVDEMHRHKTPELAEILQKSAVAREQPLVITLTTADYDRPSRCNDLLRYSHSVCANQGDRSAPGYDPAFLPVVFEADKDDDWTQPETWHKANPSLGYTLTEEALAREAKKAAESPAELTNFLRLHLNIVTQSAIAYFDMRRWDACRGPVTIEQAGGLAEWVEAMGLKGRRCYGALDLAATTDQTACVLVFPPEDEGDPWVVLPFFWIPAARAHKAEERDKVPYMAWHRMGLLEFTEGDTTDYDHIEERILQLGEMFEILELAYDPWNATQIAEHLQGAGVTVIKFRQGFISMSEPTKELDRKVRRGEIAHGGHPLLRWCAENTMVRVDPAENVKPDKAKSTGRIDGIVATVMALGRATLGPVDLGSVYDERGPIIV